MILVTGATGFVGSKIMELCDDTVAAPSLRNVTEYEVRSLVEDIPPLHNLWMDCSKARKYGVVFSEELEGLLRCARDCGMIR